jgi:hypothetical protein
VLSPSAREEKTSSNASSEDYEHPEPNRCLEVEPQEVEVTGFGVLENKQQRDKDNDGRDDLPSGGAPLLFRQRL